MSAMTPDWLSYCSYCSGTGKEADVPAHLQELEGSQEHCAYCQKPFEPARKGHRFCSAKCQRNAKKTRELNMV